MFTGLHEIDRASMTHAYGPATEVPDLLRGLVSDDPREREAAVDGMYGAVHHQGDVYDSTLACILFLFELVTDRAVQDRGAIVGLLASIGGIDIGGDDFDGDEPDEPDAEEAEWRANYAMAHAAVRAGADIFLALLNDPDPDVRREVPPVLTAWPDLDELLYDRCDPLLSAVAALAGYADAAAPAVPEVLRILRNAPARHREWTLLSAARALGRIGPAAREAVPDLTALVGDASHSTAIAAASALRRIGPGTGADTVLPVLHRHLAGPVRSARAAVQAIAELGPAAASAKPRLRGLLTVSEPWLRLDAAVALWRVTGDSAAALPVLRASWRDNAHTRRDVARCAAEMGPAAAVLGPLLSRELAAVRRHNHSESGYGSHDISADLRLPESCRHALSRLAGPGV